MAEFSKSCDLNQWQKLLVDVATGFAGDKRPSREPQGREPAAITADGLKSADKPRAEKLSPEERMALARKAVQARWYRPLASEPPPIFDVGAVAAS